MIMFMNRKPVSIYDCNHSSCHTRANLSQVAIKCSEMTLEGSSQTVSSAAAPHFHTRFKLYRKTVLILLSLVFILPVWLASVLYRRFVSAISKWLAPELSHILPLHASLYINQNVASDVWSNILIRFRIRGQLNLQSVKARFVERFVYATNSRTGRLAYPELQQFAWKWAGYHFWKWESDFKVDDHIIHQAGHKAPLQGSELDALEVQFLKKPFDLEKSPWQILIVDNIEVEANDSSGEPSFLVLFKFHHSLSDGVSMFNALMGCADEKVSALKLPTPQRKSPITRLFNWVTFPLQASYEFGKLTHQKSVESPWDVDMIDQSATQVTKRHVTRSVPLDKGRVKNLAVHHGVSFSAVLLAAIAGGIRKFLLLKKKPGEIPEYMVCEVPVPVEEHPEGLTNAVCVVSFILPVGCPDARRRLQICERSVIDRKCSTEPKLTHLLFNLFALMPDIFPKIPYNFPPVAFSVFPGPLAPAKFNGHELFEMSYVLLSVPVVFAVSMLTYADGLQFFCTGDSRVFAKNDIQQIVNDIEDEFSFLERDTMLDHAHTLNGNGATVIKLPLPRLIK